MSYHQPLNNTTTLVWKIPSGYIEFRAEIFNVLDRANFGAPNGNRSATGFGTITGLSTTPR